MKQSLKWVPVAGGFLVLPSVVFAETTSDATVILTVEAWGGYADRPEVELGWGE